MSDQPSGNPVVILCRPRIVAHRVVRSFCQTCERRTYFYGWFQVWHGWHETCLSCGDAWQDEEMLERPFMPKWRQKAIEHAERRWREYRVAGGSLDWQGAMDKAIAEEIRCD